MPNLQYFNHLTLSLAEAGVGTLENIEVTLESGRCLSRLSIQHLRNIQVATLNQTVAETMSQFESKGISCVPVVEGDGKCLLTSTVSTT